MSDFKNAEQQVLVALDEAANVLSSPMFADAAAAFRAALEQQAEPTTCAWLPADDDLMPGTYCSACGELWSFIDGGWKENRVRFCHGCGGEVVDGAHGIKEPKP